MCASVCVCVCESVMMASCAIECIVFVVALVPAPRCIPFFVIVVIFTIQQTLDAVFCSAGTGICVVTTTSK